MMVASSLIQVHWRAVRMKVNSCLTIWPSLNGFRVWNHIWSPRLKVLKGFVCFQTKPDLQIMIMNGERQKFPPLEAIICVDSVSPDLVYQRSGRSLDQRPSWEIPYTTAVVHSNKKREGVPAVNLPTWCTRLGNLLTSVLQRPWWEIYAVRGQTIRER